MSKKIENKIRIQAAIIYMIVTVVIGAMVIYLNELRTKVNYQRENIENQHQILSLTNELVYAVSETQSLSGLYLFTKNRTYKRKYNESQELIGALMDSISFLKPEVEDTFDRISILLYNQNKNISRLNKHLSDNTPVKELTKKLKEFEQPIKNDTIILNVHNDTVVNEIVRKGFFKRLGQVFKPSQDSARLIITQRVDTIKGISADSLSIIYDEVENIAQQAGLAYEKSLKDIERQVALLVKADNEISVELSALLMDFQKETLETTLSLIDESQAMIETNYSYSVWAGVICLILIMLLIFLIIADVNKGYKARMALEKANETIKQTMESRHKLLLSVSHDIKTPLNSIMGYLELMKEKENTSSMISSGTHILSMLDNLLEFSSLEQGKLQISNSDFNLKTVSEDIFQMFMPLDRKSVV